MMLWSLFTLMIVLSLLMVLRPLIFGKTSLDNMDESTADNSYKYQWLTVTIIVLLVPSAAIILYLTLGSPDIVNPSQGHQDLAQVEQRTITDMISKLENRLEEESDDVEGWSMLARSYLALRDYEKAVPALQRLYELVGDQPDVMLSYADALAMVNDGKLSGKPKKLIEKALELEPENTMGLWLAGIASAELGDYQSAINYWRRLEPLLQNNDADLSKIREMIAQTEQKLGNGSTDIVPLKENAKSENVVTVNISLAEELREKTMPEDTLFIFAKAINGPPMPLAAVKQQVSDLPVTVTLDDSMAMVPSQKISNFTHVLVSARISKSGNTTAQPGDMVTRAYSVTVGQQEPVKLIIDNEIKSN